MMTIMMMIVMMMMMMMIMISKMIMMMIMMMIVMMMMMIMITKMIMMSMSITDITLLSSHDTLDASDVVWIACPYAIDRVDYQASTSSLLATELCPAPVDYCCSHPTEGG